MNNATGVVKLKSKIDARGHHMDKSRYLRRGVWQARQCILPSRMTLGSSEGRIVSLANGWEAFLIHGQAMTWATIFEHFSKNKDL
jgi:hypothetical protein